MGGGGKTNVEPKEEIDIDTTNVGLWNISESGVSTIGVGEVLTIVVLVMVMAIIIKYCCKRMKVARRNELEETIRTANTGIYRSSAMQMTAPHVAPGFAQPQAIPMVTFETPGQRQVQYSSQPALPGPSSYWETCK